ncbi:MAG: hypothetical protein GF384_06645 [Elusimicrobia bacterium]|nr:hypothetical protein [Elusimicrobiota bacterium]
MKGEIHRFNPLYTITPKLLDFIKQIYAQIALLNTRSFPKVILAEFESHAREISAFSSTSIEGNPLPLTEVRKILKTKPHNISTSQKEVINYNNTLLMLNNQLKYEKGINLNLSLVLTIHKMTMKDLSIKAKCGKLRNEPVFANDPRLRKTVYWPPDQKDVPFLMGTLIDYIKNNRSTIDPILLAGIFHKQFVVIHPFIDGNGRTVRLATKVLLADMGLNTFNLFSFENYYNRNVSRYFQNVGLFGNYYDIANSLNYTAWLEYFAEGILDELFRVSKELNIAAVEPSKELKDYHKSILKFIEEKGFITDREYAKITKRAKPTRALDFNKLIQLGYIERIGKGKATYYRPKKLS